MKGKILAVDIDSEGRFVFRVSQADALLFKAAPQMYKALKIIQGWLQGNIEKVGTDCEEADMLKEITPAITNAEGKQS